MSKPVRFGSVISLVAASSMMAACAAPQGQALSASSASVKGDVGLAIRAAAALNANDYVAAIGFAERAAAKTPNDVTVRALLGNAYFASGRFASAEAAYKDCLFVESNQPGVILKLVLVEIAQGKAAEAMTFLQAGKDVLEPADYGLALALAGRPEAGVAVLEPAARAMGADARVRQNLALAYALSGDWNNARTIAAQDVPGDQLDARIQQWMQLASPHRASDQVAALVGVTPAASDPGQPIQLALRGNGASDARLAEAAPAVQPAASMTVSLPPARPVEVAAADPAPEPAPQLALAPAAVPAPAPAPLPPVEAPLPSVPQAPVLAAALPVEETPLSSPPAPAPLAALVKAPARVPARKPVPVRKVLAALRQASARNGRSGAVVQLGAYANPQRVAAAWNAAARRNAGLRGYTPTSARFVSARGPVYRLAVRGFASYGEANALCVSLRRSGENCFVRNFAGDAPVQIAMR